jgi:hypothetical protein
MKINREKKLEILFYRIDLYFIYLIKLIDGSIQWKLITNEKSQRFFVFI